MSREPSQVTERAAQVALVLAFVLPGALLYAWSRPISSPPREVPPLALSPSEVREQLSADEAVAQSAPTGEAAETREATFAEFNLAEVEADDYPPDAADRRRRIDAATEALEAEHGAEGLAAARAADVARMEQAIAGELDEGETHEALGVFVEILNRYGMAEGGQQVAPRFVVRTAFKARWNVIHGRPATDGLSPVELQAHWGWLALNGGGAPLELRLEAVEQFAEAGGARADEARGALLVEAGRMQEARTAFEGAYEAEPSFRLRNHALYAAEGEEDR